MSKPSFGFRGEPLPSIAAVSKHTLTTRAAGDVVGTQLQIVGGRLGDVRDVAWPGGTEMAVRDLFFNIPARSKFLKSDSTESYHVAREYMVRLGPRDFADEAWLEKLAKAGGLSTSDFRARFSRLT